MDSSTQQKITLVACRLLTIFIWVTTVTRPLVVDLSAVFTLIGVVEGIIALLLYASVRTGLLGRAAPVVVTFALPLMCLPLILISGGVNSPITFILLVFPFYATLVMGPKFSWITTGLICGAIGLVGMYAERIVNVLDMPYSEQITYARTYWIISALLIGAVLSTSFSGLAENLTKTLQEEANMDLLTRIANRRGLEKSMDREANTARRHHSWLSLIFLDIDDFKTFNDAHGSAAGDDCLVQVADSLQSASRAKQDYVGRWGEEEFVLILPDTDPDEAKSIAELVRREIEFMETLKNKKGTGVTATLGCCTEKGDDADISKMLKAAERALHAGKSRGKNRVVAARVRA